MRQALNAPVSPRSCRSRRSLRPPRSPLTGHGPFAARPARAPIALAAVAAAVAAALALCGRPAAAAGEGPLLPLPEAPVVVVVPDPGALDRALTGRFREALSGTLAESDPVGSAFRKTRVGGKLEEQWAAFAGDLPLTWTQIAALRPNALGVALLSAGNLEAVLAVRTPLADLPVALPKGDLRSHAGVSYTVASRGAGDEETATRRMGIAWARPSGMLLVATSERALKLALERLAAGDGFGPFLPGLVSARLDLAALRKDLYFRREFLFAEGVSGPESGFVRAALRLEGGSLVEVREGESAPMPAAGVWPVTGRDVAAAGWETDSARLFAALRRGLLEPIPSPPSRPETPLQPLPDTGTAAGERYLVDMRQAVPQDAAGGVAELDRWAKQLAEPPLAGWGWEVAKDGAVRIVVRRAAAGDAELLALARETFTRRAGAVGAVAAGRGDSFTVGPELPALALRRRGEWLWLAARPADLADVPEPRLDDGVSRWGRLDLDAARREGAAWERAEGAAALDRTRPFSDRILGLLGWVPSTRAISVERRRAGTGFTERIVFEGGASKGPG